MNLRPALLAVGMAVVLLALVTLPSLAFAQGAQKGTDTANAFEKWFGYFMLNIGSFFLWMGGQVLELSINELIIKMGANINESLLGVMITKLWGLMRDICNLLFIFGFVWVGIKTIIDADDSGAKRALASLIIAALLINFSLYITKVVIDVSNYTAVEIYNATFVGPADSSLSASFAKSLGLYSFYEKTPKGEQLAALPLMFYVMAAILLVIAGFVFAAGGFLIITRFAVLVFIMIFSPLLFAARVFPATEDIASKLWKQLISSSFFAPAYLILLLVSAQVTQAIVSTLTKGQDGLAKGLSSGGNNFAVVLAFCVGIMFLILSLKVASQFGMVGAEKTMALAHGMRKRTQGFAGRHTLGRAGYALNKKIDEDSKSTDIGRRTTANMLKTIGVSSAAGAAAKGKYGGSASFDDGKKAAKAHDKEQAEIDELLKFKMKVEKGQKAAPGSKEDQDMKKAVAGASVKYLEELSQEQREAIAGHMTQGQIDGLDKSTEIDDTEKSKIHDARQKALQKMFEADRKGLAKASVDHLNALGVEYLKREDNALHLNSSQMDDLKKKLTPSEFAELNTARTKALEKLVRGPIKTLDTAGNVMKDTAGNDIETEKSHITGQKPGEIAKMPAEVLKALSTELSVAVLTKIYQDGTLNTADQATVKRDIMALPPANPQRIAAVAFFSSPLGLGFGR